MGKRFEPEVIDYTGAKNTHFIRISFIPDYIKFKM